MGRLLPEGLLTMLLGAINTTRSVMRLYKDGFPELTEELQHGGGTLPM